MKFSLKKIADDLGGVLIGNGDIVIRGVSEIDKGEENTITFLGNMKYKKYLYSSKAAAFFVDNKNIFLCDHCLFVLHQSLVANYLFCINFVIH